MVTVENIMENVQVYASAWALVGSRLDDGNLLAQADSLRAKIHRDIQALCDAQGAQQEGQ